MVTTKTFRLTRLPKGESLGLTQAQSHHLMSSLLEIKKTRPQHIKAAKQQLQRHTISSGPAKDTPRSLLQSLRVCWTQGQQPSGKQSSKKKR